MTPVEAFIPPVAQAAANNSEQFQRALKRLKRVGPVVITGMSGAGKSVLKDHLTNAVDAPYKLPQQSPNLETSRLPRSKRRLWRVPISVVPGQNSPERRSALESQLNSRRAPSGIVHVVPFGYVEQRRGASQRITHQATQHLDEYREAQLEAELVDLVETLAAIRTAQNQKGKPAWLIVAMSKADLYWKGGEEAIQRYCDSDTGSPFSDLLNELQRQVGSDNFIWETMPISCVSEAFTYGSTTVTSELPHDRRAALMSELLTRIVTRTSDIR